MAWSVHGENLQMVEGDYGLALPIDIVGTTLTEHDNIRMVFKNSINSSTLLTKEFSEISENSIILSLSESESAIFPVGSYVYSLDWYQDGAFMCNIIPTAAFRVVDKA